MFSEDIQKKLRKEGFDLESKEENIWIKEKGEQSITISGDDDCIEAIWQTFGGKFKEFERKSINEVLTWSEGKLN